MNHPALTSDHVGTNHIRKEIPSTHIWPCGNIAHNPVKKSQHSHPFNQWSEWPSTYTWPCEEPILHAKRLCTYIWSTNDRKKAIALISDQPMIEERHSTYIWSTNYRRKAQHLYLINQWLKKGSALTSETCKEPIEHACLKMHALTFDLVGTNPTVISEWPPVLDWATW